MCFDGVLISDWAAIEELIAHGVAEDRKDAARMALEAGVDIDMMTSCYCQNLCALVEEGKVQETLIDEAVLRILELKNRLLKNEGERIAFIGPHVSDKWITGAWSMYGRREETVSVEEGVRNKGVINVSFIKGSALLDNLHGLAMFAKETELAADAETKETLLQEAEDAARAADKVVLVLGEFSGQSGEAACRADITIPECQQTLFRRVVKANPETAWCCFVAGHWTSGNWMKRLKQCW